MAANDGELHQHLMDDDGSTPGLGMATAPAMDVVNRPQQQMMAGNDAQVPGFGDDVTLKVTTIYFLF